MRKLAAIAAILALPTISSAQVTSVFGRTGAVTAQTNDYTCAQINNCAPLSGTNIWTAPNSWSVQYPSKSTSGTSFFPIINGANMDGAVSSRVQTMLQVVGSSDVALYGTDEVNVVDAFAYDGLAQYDAERYNRKTVANSSVLNGQTIGTYSFEPFDGASDSNTAAMIGAATENQDHASGHHGTALNFTYTPNGSGSNLRYSGLTISRGGLGGVTIGDTAYQAPPADMGKGTLNVVSSIYADNGLTVADNVFHLRGMAGAGAPEVNNSGVVAAGSSDNRGEITGGTPATFWEINWQRNWPTRPFCTVSPLQSGAGTVTVSPSVSSFGITFSNLYNGGFDWVCL